MTITNQDLIDAAKAIGINVFHSRNNDRLLTVNDRGGFIDWEPRKDKSQLIDLFYKLKMDINFFPEGGGYLNQKVIPEFIHFADYFESFAEAIILASAEHYRAGVKKDA